MFLLTCDAWPVQAVLLCRWEGNLRYELKKRVHPPTPLKCNLNPVITVATYVTVIAVVAIIIITIKM